MKEKLKKTEKGKKIKKVGTLRMPPSLMLGVKS